MRVNSEGRVFDLQELQQSVDTELQRLADPEEAARAARYYGSGGPFLGVRIDALHRLADDLDLRLLGADDTGAPMEFAESLWQRGAHEHRFLAALLIGMLPKPYSESVWVLCDRWLDDADTWELVDRIAVGIVGEMIAADSSHLEDLRHWTESGSFWRQRAAIMALLPLNTDGRSHPEETFAICGPLMLATESHVRHALAWVLRETGAAAPDATATFLLPYKFKVVNSLLREAARKLPRHLERAIVGG